MEASLRFYEDIIGLKLTKRFSPTGGMEIAFLGEGGTQVELICNQKDLQKKSCDGISLGFETDSLDETRDSIERNGFKVHSGPFQPNPHTRFMFVLDPDGYTIQFMENF